MAIFVETQSFFNHDIFEIGAPKQAVLTLEAL